MRGRELTYRVLLHQDPARNWRRRKNSPSLIIKREVKWLSLAPTEETKLIIKAERENMYRECLLNEKKIIIKQQFFSPAHFP